MTEKLVKRDLASEERHDRVGKESARFVGSIVEVGRLNLVIILTDQTLCLLYTSDAADE